ncbi:MAG TPA: peptidoglycan-associated lipoprotein Pal [Steroidobacteraceae bacterium]|nr:peptidoglycan-associated lipoprotein Pal [Steroidobacteraceae bacterium]
MKRTIAMTFLIGGALLLAACHGKQAVVNQPTAGSVVPAGGSTSGSAAGSGTSMTPLAGGSAAAAAIANEANNAPLDTRVIYFDFDKSEIKPQYDDVITAHARTLTANPTLRIKLEGNTDERGTREYNIGLGERRAQAVRSALMLQGVADAQITTISYGAERPAVEGDNEAAWSKNRRVDMVYMP